MAKDITIDGRTYTGIESVSINGNIFGEGSTDYTEEVLRRNYSPNGQSFMDEVTINFAEGDYIETKFDITNQPDGRICFAVGTNITVWATAQNKTDTIAIYKSGAGVDFYALTYMHSGSETTASSNVARSINRLIPYGNKIIKAKIDASGLWINDVLTKPSEYETYNPNIGNGIYPVRYALLDATTIQVGAAQSDSDYSYATYEYVKVFRKS